MIISVIDEAGERYSYDTNKASYCLFPSRGEVSFVAAALREALEFLEGSSKIRSEE